MKPEHPRWRWALGLTSLVASSLACASTPEPDPRYRPAENVLEVVAVLRRHIPDDTYRFEPARDFTGRNVYRSSLLRLESMEHLHAEALRAGYLDGVIAFAKGRALERLRAFELAADAYRLAADRDPELAEEARRSAELCEALEEASRLAPDLEEFAGSLPADPREADATLARFEERSARLEQLEAEVAGSHYAAVVREEIERTDVARARYFAGLRWALPEGDVRAVAELQRVVARHRESKYVARHLLALAGLYEDLAIEYVDAHPPASLHFDPVDFQELLDAGSRLYEIVASRDGTPEKLEASRKLEALLAFALTVDRDRFTP